MNNQNKQYSPQEIQSLILLIDTCILEANQTISTLHQQLDGVKEENLQLKDKLNQYEENVEDMQLILLEKGEEIKKLQGLLEVKHQQNQLKVSNNGMNSNRNDDLSHFLKIIESLNQENKQLRQQIELLQYENQKAIQLACSVKNSKLFKEINNKLDIQSPLSNSNIENHVIGSNINDTFLNKSKTGNNMNINNLSYIHHNNHSFNNSTNEILKKFNLNDSTNIISANQTLHNYQLTATNDSTNFASTKKNYKYLKPKK